MASTKIKLNDSQKKKIIADYIETQNYSESARMNNVSFDTVKKLVDNDEVRKKLEEKKEQNTNDILKYMEQIEKRQEKIIDLSLDALEEKLSNLDKYTNVKDIATVYGVIFDKALKYREMQLKQMELSKSTNNIDNMETLADLLRIDKK